MKKHDPLCPKIKINKASGNKLRKRLQFQHIKNEAAKEIPLRVQMKSYTRNIDELTLFYEVISIYKNAADGRQNGQNTAQRKQIDEFKIEVINVTNFVL